MVLNNSSRNFRATVIRWNHWTLYKPLSVTLISRSRAWSKTIIIETCPSVCCCVQWWIY